MKKSILFILLIAVFSLTNVVSAKSSTGIFAVSKEDVKASKSLLEQHEYKGLTMKYPSNWVKAEQKNSNSQFFLLKSDSTDDFKASMNILIDVSTPYLALMPLDFFAGQYMQKMQADGYSSIEFIRVEKGKWQGHAALYSEYKAVYMEHSIHCVQYMVDNGKNMFVITFASSENEWDITKMDMQKMLASIVIR